MAEYTPTSGPGQQNNTDTSPVAAAAAAARTGNNGPQTTDSVEADNPPPPTAPKETFEPTPTSEQNPAPQLQQVDADAPGREQADKTVEPGDDNGPKHPAENAPDENSEETKQHKAKGETWTGASWIKFDKVKPGDPEMSSGKELEDMENQAEKEDEAAHAKATSGAGAPADTGAKKEGILGKVQEKLHKSHHDS